MIRLCCPAFVPRLLVVGKALKGAKSFVIFNANGTTTDIYGDEAAFPADYHVTL